MADYGDLNLIKRELSFGGSSKVQWTPTAARTIQLPNKSGTIALLDDVTGGSSAVIGLSPRWEVLSIATANTVPNLAAAPAANTQVLLIVEGVVESSLGANPAFTVSGQSIAWSAANAGYTLPVGARVIALYWVAATSNQPALIRSATRVTVRPDGSALQDGDIWIDTRRSEQVVPFQWIYSVDPFSSTFTGWFSRSFDATFSLASLGASAEFLIAPKTCSDQYENIFVRRVNFTFKSSTAHDANNYLSFDILRVAASGVETSISNRIPFTSLEFDSIPGSGVYNTALDDYGEYAYPIEVIDAVATGIKHFKVRITKVGNLSITDLSVDFDYQLVVRSDRP